MCHGAIFSALLTRGIFCSHVLISVGLAYVHIREKWLWLVLLVLVLLLIETIYIIGKRKGEEYQYFWPSGFLYLVAILTVIWIMELFLLQERLDNRRPSYERNERNETIKFQGIDIKEMFNSDVAAKKVGQLGLVIFMIVGRWLLPRGELTRDQLSALLLGYIGMGADILDLFSSLSHPNVIYNVTVHYVMLAIFSWSMLQFCITATVTAGSENTQTKAPVDTAEDEKTKRVSFADSPISISDEEAAIKSGRPLISSNKSEPDKRSLWNADRLQIFLPILMQDGPFLIIRLVLLIKFGVTNEIHIYFTGKNTLIISLLLYRLYSLNAKEVPRTQRCQGARDSVCIESFTIENEFPDYDVFLQNTSDNVFGSLPRKSRTSKGNPDVEPKVYETEPTDADDSEEPTSDDDEYKDATFYL